MRKPTVRRVIAYLFDVIAIGLIASALANVKILNPYYEEYKETQDHYEEVLETAAEDPVKFNELVNSDELTDLSYDINKTGVFVSIYTIVLSFLYFVFFQYYTKGKTLGKLLMRIEVVSNDKKELRLIQLIKRSIVINSIVTGTIMCILVITLSKDNYLNYSRFIQLIEYVLIITSLGFVIYREDGIGLHDLFGGTRVISVNDEEFFYKHEEVEKKKEVKEAKVVKKKEK